jgi:sugar lactone lactonase YvrE
MQRSFLFLLALAGLSLSAYAVGTRTWQQKEYAEFDKGNLKKLSLRSDGRLTLAPVFEDILDSSSAYLWTIAEDSKGNLYAGGGGPGGPGARVYIRSKDGKSKVLAELDGLEIHAIVIDKKDRLFAAAAPDGKVYRISPDGNAEVFYDPGAKYIWAMAFDSNGDLFLATGNEGAVHRVTPDGKGSVFFRTEETHARSLVIDGNDNLIVGTEPGGLILRISPSGEGFVLYQAPKSEITAVAVAKDGSIYAAGVGRKKPAAPAPGPPRLPVRVTPAPKPTSTLTPAPNVVTAQRPVTRPPSLVAALPAVTGGSEIYRIDPDGFPQKVWSHPGDLAYAIGFDAEGRPLIGTGNQGVVYRLDSDLLYTALVTAAPTQVTSFCAGRQGQVYATTGNIGKVYQIGPGLEREGSIESDVFDAGLFSLWGRLVFGGNSNGGGVRFETRAGNLDRPRRDWSRWELVTTESGGGPVPSPKARFLQWRLTLTAPSGDHSPEVQSVEVAYLPRNVAPVIEKIEITPANYRFPPKSLALTLSKTITLQPLSRSKKTVTPKPIVTSSVTSVQYAKGQIGGRWAATDQNGDALLYKVEIRGAEESEWKLLKDNVAESHLSWDSTSFPDGEYLLRVTGSDAPDNPPDQALNAELVSETFLIDNMSPEISTLSASPEGGKLVVSWKAKDAHSRIRRAEYSVNGGEWIFVEPTTRLSDWREHDYRLRLERASPGEQTIAVRVTDEFQNQAVEKIVVR